MFRAIAEGYACYIHYDISCRLGIDTRYHVFNHNPGCQLKYLYEGQIHSDGEIVERAWAEGTSQALEQKEMGLGVRRGLLDDYLTDEYLKNVCVSAFLSFVVLDAR
jgi:hypothetical protein